MTLDRDGQRDALLTTQQKLAEAHGTIACIPNPTMSAGAGGVLKSGVDVLIGIAGALRILFASLMPSCRRRETQFGCST